MKMKDDQFIFSFFQVMEYRWNEIDRGKPKYSGKNLLLRNGTIVENAHKIWSIADLKDKKQEAELIMVMLIPLLTQCSHV
jgi:hypothetical protein